MTIIKEVFARQILDSRGNPTVEADVLTEKRYNRTCCGPFRSFHWNS